MRTFGPINTVPKHGNWASGRNGSCGSVSAGLKGESLKRPGGARFAAILDESGLSTSNGQRPNPWAIAVSEGIPKVSRKEPTKHREPSQFSPHIPVAPVLQTPITIVDDG